MSVNGRKLDVSIATLVSAVIPARNAEACLARAIESALAQSYPNIEIIVIDDGSEDATYEVAMRYGTRVRVIRLPRSLGPAAARNVGIEAANGTYIGFLDADDEWLPEKTARQVAVIDTVPDMIFIFCRAAFVSPVAHAPALVHENRKPAAGPEAWKTLLAYPFVCTPTVLARRDAVLRAGLFDPMLPIAEDQDLWIRLARLGPIGHLEDVLARVHDTPESVTKWRALDGVTHTLKVIAGHVKAASGELSPQELRRIWAERYFSLGRNAYEAGGYILGMELLLRSIGLGQPVLSTLRYLLATSLFGRSPKRNLKTRCAVNRGQSEPGATKHSQLDQ